MAAEAIAAAAGHGQSQQLARGGGGGQAVRSGGPGRARGGGAPAHSNVAASHPVQRGPAPLTPQPPMPAHPHRALQLHAAAAAVDKPAAAAAVDMPVPAAHRVAAADIWATADASNL